MIAVAPTTSELRARSVAYVLLARLLGPDVTTLADEATTEALDAALVAAGGDDLVERLHRRRVDASVPADVLAGRWVRWFELGRVAPYEGSNVAATSGGVTPRLADVAGFYRAFNLGVVRERPDHVIAQLEFLAVALLAEAEAGEQGDPERAEIAAQVVRAFVRDHVGAWLTAWAARIGAIDELSPWFPYAAAAAELVDAEARLRHVIPLREDAVLPADAGVAADEEALIACEEAPSGVALE